MTAVRDIEFLQISADWNSITLGEKEPQALLVMRNGLTKKQDMDGGDFKVSRIETIGNGWIDESRVRYASQLKEQDIEKYRLRKGDILFSHINSDRHLGKTGIAEHDYEDLLHGMNLLLIRANPDVFDPHFLNRVFQYYRDIGVFIAICSRAVNQSSINQAKMKALEIPLPPLPEQKKIAHILSTVQRAIETQERIIHTTTELKKALMQKLFTEGLSRPSGKPQRQKQTEIGPAPESWEESTLGELTTMRTGGTPSRKNKDFWEGGKIPWVKTGEINYHEITTTEESITDAGLKGSNAKLFPKGTLLMAMYGQGITRGRVSLLGIDATTNQACAAITTHDEKRVSTDYLYFYLEYFYEELRSRGHGANQKNLSMTLLKLFPVVFPVSDEQHEIVTVLKGTDTNIALARTRRTTFQDFFRTLLHELMTAKTRVHKLELST